MAFLNFFREKEKKHIDSIAQSVGSVIDERLAELNERLRRIENKQKETSIQLEEIDNSLQNGDETVLVDTLTALADTIGDFYLFAAADPDSPLYEQAQMMWNTAKSAAENAGLEIIDASNEPFDFRFHSAESAEQDIDIPNGYVIKTIKFGYIYKNEVMRRAAVIINKIEKDEENETDTPNNIIYL